MDSSEWTIGADGRSATHSSGFTLSVEGNPKDPQGVNPGRFPAGLSAIEQVRLLRLGVEAIAAAAKAGQQKRSAPERPVLSIRKRESDTKTPA